MKIVSTSKASYEAPVAKFRISETTYTGEGNYWANDVYYTNANI